MWRVFRSVLLILLSSSIAAAETPVSEQSEERDRIYYKDGMTFEAGNQFSLKLNLMLIYRYRYIDRPSSEDVDDFSPTNVRLYARGDILDKQFSYYINNDFVGGTIEGRQASALRDAFLQWNLDPAAKIVLGQFRVPFSRSWLGGSHALQMLYYPDAVLYFYKSREGGVQLTGSFGEKGNTNWGYYVGVFNGESTGEGIDKPGVDPDVTGAAQAFINFNGYDRGYEGDPGFSPEIASTAGASAYYGEGHSALKGSSFCAGSNAVPALCAVSGSSSHYNHWETGVDAALRTHGYSIQSEAFAGQLELTDTSEGPSQEIDYGMYVQSGYFFVPKEWEAAARFGVISFDRDVSPIRNRYEYELVLAHYFWGHNLKMQVGPSWLRSDRRDESTLNEKRLQAQVVGFF